MRGSVGSFFFNLSKHESVVERNEIDGKSRVKPFRRRIVYAVADRTLNVCKRVIKARGKAFAVGNGKYEFIYQQQHFSIYFLFSTKFFSNKKQCKQTYIRA